MIPSYPTRLPMPQRSGYAIEPVNKIRRTEMDTGRAMQRWEFEDAPSFPQITWRFNELQARLFVAWVNQVAKAGWFTMPLLTNMGFDTLTVRFTETPKGGQLLGKFIWEYTALCEIQIEPQLEEGWAEILPEYVLYADIFDRAINEQWPYSPYAAERDAGVFDFAVNEQWPPA